MLAGLEVGGTKIVCAAGTHPRTILARSEIPTGPPADVVPRLIAFLRDHAPLRAIGIGSFGPLDLDPGSPHFGAITRTPKPGWSGANLRSILAEALACPAAVDTDVNASGIAEAAFGAGQGLSSIAYITVGTGIGGALIVRGIPLHGLTHPEMGHIRPRRHPRDSFGGACPFHQDCLEGLASGFAIHQRSGRKLADLPPDDPVWQYTADYLGQLCATLVLMAAPQRIVMGGGVMASNPALFPLVREATAGWLGGYVQSAAILRDIDTFIVPPGLAEHAGVIGALMLAQRL